MTYKDKEKLREYKRKWSADHRDKDKEREKMRKYRAANPEKILEQQRKRREDNRAEFNAYARDWQRKWRKDNPEKAKEKDRLRYSRTRKNSPEWQAHQAENQRKRAGRVDSGRRKGVRKSIDMKYVRDLIPKRRSYLRTRYGITIEEWNEMFEKQGGFCAICGNHYSTNRHGLQVDHNHKTGKVRGLLCHHCNTGIGNLRDDVRILEKAIVYLSA